MKHIIDVGNGTEQWVVEMRDTARNKSMDVHLLNSTMQDVLNYLSVSQIFGIYWEHVPVHERSPALLFVYGTETALATKLESERSN